MVFEITQSKLFLVLKINIIFVTDKIIEPADNTKIDTANKAEGSELIAVAIKVYN